MRRLNWREGLIIETEEDYELLLQTFKEIKPDYAGFDTETTGLHIAIDKAFLVQFGFYNEKTRDAFACLVDLEVNTFSEKVIKTFWMMAKICKKMAGHNIKYDLHMTDNINLPYIYNNLTDTQVLIRLTSDALTSEKGGELLALKIYAYRHIEREAKYHEQLLRSERTQIATSLNMPLRKKIKELGWKWSTLQDFLKDPVNSPEELPKPVREAYFDWFEKVPPRIKIKMRTHLIAGEDIPYNLLNKKNLYKYGLLDIVYTLETLFATLPIIKVRKQERTLKREEEVIRPLYKMEKQGFYMNKPYIKECEVKLKSYIIRRRKDLEWLAGEQLSCNQNKRILELLRGRFKSDIKSTGKDVLNDYVKILEVREPNNKIIPFIKTIQELRTLEKWYQTYLMRFVKEEKHADRIYTQLNQAGAVTGRLSSDFQQFPKGAIKDNEGNELFIPRRMIQTPPGYAGMVFIDYSQIELRLQAMYTILVGHPDTNLCRAYMPYNCINNNKELFDYKNPEHIKNYKEYEWYLVEDVSTSWHPTDVHSATTKEAFPDIAPDSPEFKEYRNKGKTVNFAKNYGAQKKQIAKLFPQYDDETIATIDGAYYKAFPGVKEYHKYCYDVVHQGFGTNLFGRRYYNMSGHNYMNAAIQGSGADFLKEAITKLDKFMIEHNCVSKMFINIHDEIGWLLAHGEEHFITEWQKIMEEFDGTYVPIIADIDYTTTTWNKKEGIDNVEDIININKT